MKSEAKLWLKFAKKDIISAEALADIEEYDNALYHLQQASDFNIPAFIRTHNIERLINIISSHGINVPKEIKEAYKLTKYAFTTRYPDDYVPVSKEEYEEAYKIALKVYEWAKGVFGK